MSAEAIRGISELLWKIRTAGKKSGYDKLVMLSGGADYSPADGGKRKATQEANGGMAPGKKTGFDGHSGNSG
jgi:hypothetical protein